MQVYRGEAAFSSFRLEKLLTEIRLRENSVENLQAETLYILESETELTHHQQSLVKQLLPLSDEVYQNLTQDQWQFIIIPRLGTISSWSSKATDILHVCGLSNVKRIERGIIYRVHCKKIVSRDQRDAIANCLHDRMTESVLETITDIHQLLTLSRPTPSISIPLQSEGKQSIIAANQNLGLALSEDEMDYLFNYYKNTQRDPTTTELMMFAQVNSEHCRHKIFNARWVIEGVEQPYSLFEMIRNTHHHFSEGVLSAYHDNGAILKGSSVNYFFTDYSTKQYHYSAEPSHLVIKVETHNHPTAISPFAGAATGAGGEIRDEGATGIGAKPKAGLTGFSVSHLHIPHFHQPWEIKIGHPQHIASPLKIMLEGPIGAASFNNEFGRPNLCGYFRTFEMRVKKNESELVRGYHKPIMIAGGIGQIREHHLFKKTLASRAKVIVLGGPGMLIGLGGGAASSLSSNENRANLDFASVQRSNPEMQRRCQEVINACWSLAENNPILSIHDVGAGGLSNALPELVHSNGGGGHFDLRAIPIDDPSLSPLAIWCNEAQERYVLVIHADALDIFNEIAVRERCPYAVVGEVTDNDDLTLVDNYFDQCPVNVSMSFLFHQTPKQVRAIRSCEQSETSQFQQNNILLSDAIKRVLQFPCVADKSFLITIGDRSVTGLVARDQMVGPWQVPVADVAVTASAFDTYVGEAMAMGERTPLAVIDAEASARMAVGEAITNIAAASISSLSDIKLSANWMAAANFPGEDEHLYKAVKAIGMELCPALDICIPVGKDSLSMSMQWKDNEETQRVVAPVSLIISAFAPVNDCRKTVTPQLTADETAELLLIDLGQGQNRLGGSALAQVYQQLGDQTPDVDDSSLLKNFFQVIQSLNKDDLLLAYHDRSDGGLITTLCEMAFASHVGLSITIDTLGDDALTILFNEELGAVLQIRQQHKTRVIEVLKYYGLLEASYFLGHINLSQKIMIQHHGKIIFSEKRVILHRWWSETSYRMQSLRDNSHCAQQQYDAILDEKDPGLQMKATFHLKEDGKIKSNIRPKVAILREQGVNGHVEMAAAFHRVGFNCIDVHMTDVLKGCIQLNDFKGLVACGGFSYGDVLGAGQGWAKSILFNIRARNEFERFFQREDTFTLGVCNGCQMLSQLRSLIPGSEWWPDFIRNTSEQFEARLSLVTLPPSPSIFFRDMEGSQLPIAVAHGEGQAIFRDEKHLQQMIDNQLIAMQFIDHYGHVTENYPFNPNGSPQGITGLTTIDGRVTILMPHPERVFRTIQLSWHSNDWQSEDSPWIRMFQNARVWVNNIRAKIK